MKNKLMICLTALLLTACSSQTVSEEALPETEASTETSASVETEDVAEETTEAVTEEETAEENTEETIDESDVYTAKLEEIMLSKGYTQEMYSVEPYSEDILGADALAAFELIDLDSDGSDELVFSGGVYHQCITEIYTVKDNELVRVDLAGEEKELLCNPLSTGEEAGDFLVLGSSGVFMLSDDGYIFSEYTGMGQEHRDYFRFENGSISRVISMRSDMWYVDESGNEREYYSIDKNEVTKEEFEAAKAEYSDKNWQSVGQQNFFMPTDYFFESMN